VTRPWSSQNTPSQFDMHGSDAGAAHLMRSIVNSIRSMVNSVLVFYDLIGGISAPYES